jgi:VIT1/CCC1 family predicted Fe2+/Mn2+ transporter
MVREYLYAEGSILLLIKEGLNCSDEVTTSKDKSGDVATAIRKAHLFERLELRLELVDRAGTRETRGRLRSKFRFGNRLGIFDHRSRFSNRSRDRRGQRKLSGNDTSRRRSSDRSLLLIALFLAALLLLLALFLAPGHLLSTPLLTSLHLLRTPLFAALISELGKLGLTIRTEVDINVNFFI